MSERIFNIGIFTHDFTHLPGARDLLSMFIEALAKRRDCNLYLIMFGEKATSSGNSFTNYIVELADKIIKTNDKTKNYLDIFEKAIRRSFNAHQSDAYFYEELAIKYFGDIVKECTVIRADNIDSIHSIVKKYKIDVIFPTTFPVTGVPFVSYLYDCQHRRLPEHFSVGDISARNAYFQNLLLSSSSTIVMSQDTKNDLEELFNIGSCKIYNLPFYPRLDNNVLQLRADLLRKYDLPNRFFLVSNQFWIHKSLETTFFALNSLIEQGETGITIVYTGLMEEPRVPGYIDELIVLVQSLHLENSIRFLGYIPKRDQLEIMKNSVAVIQPTLFEGGSGGGSVISAAALGVRSIVSDIPVNLELPGRDGFLEFFKAGDADDLADKMRKFWHSPPYSRPDDDTLLADHEMARSRFGDALFAAIEYAIPLKISVITVCKNVEATILNTLRSVFGQTFRHFETIVIDGASTDKTLEILKPYSDNGDISLISEPDDGIYFAMNKGLERATGDIIYFLNSGDIIASPDIFSKIHDIFKNDPLASCVFGDVEFVSKYGTGRVLSYYDFEENLEKYRNNSPCHQVMFYKRELFSMFGAHDTSFAVYGDQEFNARVFAKGKARHIHTPLVIARYLEGGYSEQMLETGLNALEKQRIERLHFQPPYILPAAIQEIGQNSPNDAVDI